MGIWTDALGFFIGLGMIGAEYALDEKVTLGLLLTHADVELDGVRAGGVGWGVMADYALTGKALSSGLVLGGALLFLPTDFEDSTQSPSLSGGIFGLGALLSLGYRFVIGPVSVQPLVSLAYLDFPRTIQLTDGTVPEARAIDKIHGTVPAAQLRIGLRF